LEPDLEQQQSQNDDLLATAAYHARDAQAQCVDVAAMMFPTGHKIPSDALLYGVSQKLSDMLSGIEQALLGDVPGVGISKASISTDCRDLLMRSGFLREPLLVDFFLARHAEEHLSVQINTRGQVSKLDQLPAQLLGSADAGIARAAQVILAADSLRQRQTMKLHTEMSPEMLHQMVWRVVAALQVVGGARDQSVVDAAQALLASHDEARIARVAARKLVYLLADKNADALQSTETAGLDLYIATLSTKTDLDHDHVLRLIAGHSSAPFATLLRACSMPSEDAMAAICLFNGFDLTPHDVSSFYAGYDSLDRDVARQVIQGWAIDRARFLAFPTHAGTLT
jgi:hypothetical protein